MNFDKSIKVGIFLVTGMLVACAPDQQQPQNSEAANKKQSVTVSNGKNHTNIKSNGVNSPVLSSPVLNSPGLKVFIDPDTGKFLDGPPPGYVEPTVKSNQKKTNGEDSNSSQDQNTTNKEQKSITPGGGYTIKNPPPFN